MDTQNIKPTESKQPMPGSVAYTEWLESQHYIALGSFEDVCKITDLSGKYYLTADITVTDFENAMLNGFSGIFDGNGHTVYHSALPVFENMSGTVKNLCFSAYKDATETEPFNTNSPIFGDVLPDGAVIENVVTDRIFGEVSNYWGSFARSVSGNATVTLINCVNRTDVRSTSVTNNQKVGGFFGIAEGGSKITFRGCENGGRVEGSQAGGFIGTIDKKGATILFEDCENTGSIEGIIGKASSDKAYGVAGGLIGGFNNVGALEGNVTVTLKNCVNTGNVLRVNKNNPVKKSTKITSGGLVGNLGTSTDTFKITLEVRDCIIANCKIGGEGWEGYAQGYAGAIIGWIENRKGTNSVTIEKVTVQNVEIEAGDPAFASLFLNTDNGTKPVGLTDCFATACKETRKATGNYTTASTGTYEARVPHSHTYGSWVIEAEPTCSEAGRRHRVCNDCKKTESQTIPATGHDYEDGVCTRCGTALSAVSEKEIEYPENLSVMSYNLQNAGQKTDSTKYSDLARMIDAAQADIIAVQECATTAAAEQLRCRLKSKDSYGVVTAVGVTSAILYNQDFYTLLEKGTEQIGTANDETGSIYNRWLFWAKFRSEANGKEFVVVSVHIEYVLTANEAQLRKTLDFMEEQYPGVPAILMGDFNITELGLNVKALTDAGYTDARKTAVSATERDQATFPKDQTILDYIFTTGMSVQYYEVMMQSFNPSDHRPIRAELSIN